jgi:hypothetical protein
VAEHPGPDALDRRPVRRLALYHVLLWAFGAMQYTGVKTGTLAGAMLTAAELMDYAALAALMFFWMRLAIRSTLAGKPEGRIGGRTFLVLAAFFASFIAFVYLMSAMDMRGVTLFSMDL